VTRKVLVPVGLAALAGAAALAFGLLRGPEGEEGDSGQAPPAATGPAVAGGPLELPQEAHTRGFFPVELGRPYSWGEILLRNEGRLPVTIDEVELVNAPPGLTILGVRAVRPRDGLIGFLPGWRGVGVTPVGLVLSPGPEGDVELVVGLRIDDLGRYGIDGVTVRYHDALERYVVHFDQRIGVCGPAARYTTEARCRGG
jgi:hypothetical protein